MASEVEKLRGTVEGIATDSSKMATSLDSFTTKFSQSREQVSRVMQGSSKNHHQQILQAIDEAEKSVKTAVEKLAHTAKVAKQFGASL